MTSDIGHFDTLRPHNGVVKVGGNNLLPVQGMGTVILNAALPNGSTNRLRLNDVPYVPTLNHSLFSWNTIKSKAVVVARDNDVHIFKQKNLISPILVADIRNKIPWLRESSQSAHMSEPTAQSAHMSDMSQPAAQPALPVEPINHLLCSLSLISR